MKRTRILVAAVLMFVSLIGPTGCMRDPREVDMPSEAATGTIAPVEAQVPARIDERAEDAVTDINGITESEQSAVDALGQ